MRRPLIAVLLVAALVTGCGDEEATRDTGSRLDEATRDTGTPLDEVEVTGEPGEKPTLEFDEPLEMTDTTTRYIEKGAGEEIAPGAAVTFDFLFVNARDGEELSTSYDSETANLVFDDQLMAGVYKGLDGVPAGSRVLVSISPTDGLGEDPSQGVLATDSLLFFAEIIDVRVPLTRAEGEAVDPEAGLPTVDLAEDGAPTITVPDTEPPTQLVVQPLIEGSGAVVEAGQTITVHYTGVIWDTNAVFDSSWERGSPATLEIGTGAVIAGWDDGLVGQKVGSQILLVVPPAKGYPDGSPDGSIKPTDTSVFVVDILDAG
ncbi:MAG: FKBP-type peptidyl-prolyl cis-trans isomerase [Acidimicrobiales bacterium]